MQSQAFKALVMQNKQKKETKKSQKSVCFLSSDFLTFIYSALVEPKGQFDVTGAPKKMDYKVTASSLLHAHIQSG